MSKGNPSLCRSHKRRGMRGKGGREGGEVVKGGEVSACSFLFARVSDCRSRFVALPHNLYNIHLKVDNILILLILFCYLSVPETWPPDRLE